ncbi:MAG TPA: B12-binding domain-containing protein [Sedimentisphaerales bacterium]|nr:B12-binding domain-containing protein [Sedimentisphaerales bacterium]
MAEDGILERYLEALLRGTRGAARLVIEEALQRGIPANAVYGDIIWPIMVEVGDLLRAGRISPVEEHLATRISRNITDQLQNKLPRRPSKGKKIVVCCGPTELEELGGQIMADLFDSDGWEVRFLGGGLTDDDLLGFVNEYGPDVLLIYGAVAKQAPDIRRLIDTIRSVGAWPNMRVMVSGGVFNRAEGLWEEIGADLFAETAVKAVQAASEERPLEPRLDRQTVNRRKRTRQMVASEVNA